MMRDGFRHDAGDLARRLGRQAEAVCRRYLSNGRRAGRYWIVGDVHNTPGQSMYVRLDGPESGKGAAGKFTDAASGEHGDLLDVIRLSLGLASFPEALEEARAFLSLPRPEPKREERRTRRAPAPTGSAEAARRLVRLARPMGGTLAETYLRARGITDLRGTGALRFHPRCWYRPADGEEREPAAPEAWPAMIAAVTDLRGRITGAHRTWLAPDGPFRPPGWGKAPVETPRRAMGELLGHAVRFGRAIDVMAAGEGIETVLALRMALPGMPMAAALSAAHLAALALPPTLRRLYVAHDNDPAGEGARDRLIERAREDGVEALPLTPRLGDWNEDLCELGIEVTREGVWRWVMGEDRIHRFPRGNQSFSNH